MKTCPTCHSIYADEQKFCPSDGTPLAGAPSPQQQQPGGQQYQQPDPWTPQGSPPPGAPPPPSWQTPPPAPKRRIWPWVLGIVAVLGIGLVALIGIIGYVAYKSADKTKYANVNVNVNSSDKGGGGDDVDISGTELYVNSRENRTGNLATHYMDFSFRYPDTWKLDPSPEPSYVRVERTDDGGGTIENFSVGWFSATGSVKGNRQVLSQAVNSLSGQIAGNFPDYQKVSEGFTKFGTYDGYELRFARAAGTSGIKYWGRMIAIPDPDGGSNGVSIIMLATSNSDEVKGPSDFGVKGELPVIIKTFKLGD